ncbi:ring finger [Moniliophthora roreri MCA 2997]|uniref:Ring finger n=2 Tax=Moniliophthora roreri TaxID=221103 RepID=V2XJJ9_MONRO|nr:ring finger [Moniliophthora roreri MCA 2997]
MSSSPEPEPVRVTRSCSNAKQENKPTTARSQKPFAVIELSDSENDSEPEDKGPEESVPGSSRTLQTRALSIQSLESIDPSHKRNPTLPKRGPSKIPLFREENEPSRREERANIDGAEDNVQDVDQIPNLDPRAHAIVIISSPPPQPEPLEQEQDSTSSCLAQVLEIMPDVQPDHATALITQHLQNNTKNVVEVVLHSLFENPNYPKIDKKGKRKATAPSDPEDKDSKKARVLDGLDYASTERDFRGGVHYTTLAIDQLMLDFPEIPKPHIRRTLYKLKSLYAPTYFYLSAEKRRGMPLPYVTKKGLHRRSAKGKAPALADDEFEREREWLVRKLVEDEQGFPMPPGQSTRDEAVPEPEEEIGDDIECGCCFSAYAFIKMIQCEDGHLFCTECMTSYAEGLLGSHNVNIVCMDQSGCKLPFPVSELRRFLPEKLMELYERIKQRKEIEMAGIEGLEECPFCEYKCVIENKEEKLFRCGNEENCGAISCRQCKKPDHLPKSCKEMEEDRVLDGRHTIEEAMTRALMRNCPKCGKGFVKEDGCNKMTCPNCYSLVCYVCRQLIPEGYAHFDQRTPGMPPPVVGSSSQAKKCPLWEHVEERHTREVEEAALKAKEEWQRENPDVDEKDIQVDIPKAASRLEAGRLPGLPNVPHLYGGMGLPAMQMQNIAGFGIPPPPPPQPIPRLRAPALAMPAYAPPRAMPPLPPPPPYVGPPMQIAPAVAAAARRLRARRAR